jgi:glutathionylspermidine synthase
MTAAFSEDPPFSAAPPIDAAEFARLRVRAIFDCCKWDPQVEDTSVLAPFPLVLTESAWRELSRLAESLSREALAAERELLSLLPLHSTLAIPRRIRRVLRHSAQSGPSPGAARVIRFDFHYTTEGWRISEANTDVPGGFNEASGFTRLLATHYGGLATPADPVESLADAILATAGHAAVVALVHATAYSDDRQVMTYLARRWQERGLRTCLASPAHLRWHRGRAAVESSWYSGPVDFIFRFFPGEWLPNLPRACAWRHFFTGAVTPMSNPAYALLSQSKRFPLAWDKLKSQLPTWRALLPRTVDPREVLHLSLEDWVFKPAFGRVGDGVGIAGVTPQKEWNQILRAVRRRPSQWVAQRRFEPVPLRFNGGLLYPCVGIYTVDSRVAGAYCRLTPARITNQYAREAAILIRPERPDPIQEPLDDRRRDLCMLGAAELPGVS